MIDMTETIKPKSDQINYDDFLTGPRTIIITGVKSTGNTNDQQPVSVGYQGDGGKPYKPCKSMRRVMVRVWGEDAAKYAGKSMTLYGDPNVIWGGEKVGGIRISHMSHIDKEINVPLTASKTKRVLYKVKPLKVDMVDVEEEETYEDFYERAKEQAENGFSKYKIFFKALNPENKKRLDDAGDHQKLKELAEAVEEEPDYGM